MTLVVKYGKFCCCQKTIDLTEISGDDYRRLTELSLDRRTKIIAYILKHFSDKQVLELVGRLTVICFDTAGPLFIRKGRTNFLADVIQAYVDKHDGKNFAKAWHVEPASLKSFKFSPQSTAVFILLSEMASAKSKEMACSEFTEWLPQNISNKVWFPILLRRAPSQSLNFSQKMQSLAHNSELLTSLFNSNLNIVENVDVSRSSSLS